MTLRSRLATVVALASVVALAGCDSNSSNNALEDLDGTYTIAELVFTPDPSALDDVDVGTRLRSTSRLQIFGGDGDVLLQSQFNDASASSRTDLTATATRGRVTFTAATDMDEQELDDLFLPRQFSLEYSADNPRDLSGNIRLTNVDLEAFDPEVYSGLPPVDGILRVRFARTTD